MLIVFGRSGGFAGISVKARIDTDSLSAEHRAELESLIDAAGFFVLPPNVNAPAGGADRFNYSISIEVEGKKHTVETNDEAAPQSLRPLLRRLKVLARSS